jgi:hypothetical protein
MAPRQGVACDADLEAVVALPLPSCNPGIAKIVS